MTIGKTKENRVKVCTLIEGGMSVRRACDSVGISRSSFVRGGWWGKWVEGGMNAVLTDGKTRNTNACVSSPGDAMESAIVHSKATRRQSAQQTRAVLQEKLDSGEISRKGQRAMSAPNKRTVGAIFKRAGGRHSRTRPRLNVKEPWNARYRVQFAKEHEDTDPDQLVFSDGKKFCLWAAEGDTGCNGYMPSRDFNLARANGWEDEEYLQWLSEVGKPLPKSKSKGLFPVFVYGAVGFNTKSELFLLEEKQPLTKDLYDQLFKEIFLPLRKTPPGRSSPNQWAPLKPGEQLWVIQDNDPKHYAWQRMEETKDWLASVDIALLQHTQTGVDGTPDRHLTGVYKGQERIPSFCPYSPDLNAPIEKCWRELQYRILNRALKGEIQSRNDHIRIIKEEWVSLEYEEVVRDGRRWPGINFWVRKWGDILREVQKQSGWDTKYM